MGKRQRTIRQGLVAMVAFVWVLIGGCSIAQAQGAETCESYQNAKVFCGVGFVNAQNLIPESVFSDYSHLMRLQESYLESIETLRVSDAQHVSTADKKIATPDKRSIYRLCKAVLNHKIAARNFHRQQGLFCKERAEVCDQRCGGKQKSACSSMKVQADFTIEMAGFHTDSNEIKLLKNCMTENEIDEELLTASVPKDAPHAKKPLPLRGPIPYSNPRSVR